MATAFSVFFSLIFIYAITMMVRLHFISEMIRRLLNEEGDWLYQHMEEFKDGRREGPPFQRYRRLPPYAIMLHKFWRLPASFERELGSVEQYYPWKK